MPNRIGRYSGGDLTSKQLCGRIETMMDLLIIMTWAVVLTAFAIFCSEESHHA